MRGVRGSRRTHNRGRPGRKRGRDRRRDASCEESNLADGAARGGAFASSLYAENLDGQKHELENFRTLRSETYRCQNALASIAFDQLRRGHHDLSSQRFLREERFVVRIELERCSWRSCDDDRLRLWVEDENTPFRCRLVANATPAF